MPDKPPPIGEEKNEIISGFHGNQTDETGWHSWGNQFNR
jgi:hypothetical protein